MAAGNWIMYDKAKKYLTDGTIDWDSASLKMALLASGYTPALTHAVFGDLTNELSDSSDTAGDGYVSGGAALTGVVTQSGSTTKLTASADSQWLAVSTITARYAAIYVNATVNTIVKPLVGYVLLDAAPADVSATAGNTLTVQRPSGGFFDLTGATS